MKLYPNITYIFIIWLTSVLITSYLGFSTLPNSGKFSHNFWESWGNWDGGHYLGIAQAGYSEKFQYAFFPLYPLLIRLLSGVTQNYLLAAVLISGIATFLGVHLLYRLVMEDFNNKIAESTIITFLLFPTSFFLLAAYSEGLFFFLAVLTFYFLRKNRLFWATVAAVLASATRLVGLAVVAGLWIEVIQLRGLNRKNWYIMFAPLGFLIYSIFLYQHTGDPFYFVISENHWQRTITSPLVGFWESLKSIFSSGFTSYNLSNMVDLIFAVFGVGFAIRSFRFLPVSLAIFCLLSVGIPLFTPTLSSMPRFLLTVFPIFILMALIKNHYAKLAFQVLSLMLLTLFVIQFITGFWVS